MSNSSCDDKARFSAKDSLGCKYSASKLKYFEDPYIESVYTALNKTSSTAAIRRSPIIHRGYYTRYECFTRVLDAFLAQTEATNRQIVFLGAGFDTLSLSAYKHSNEGIRTFDVDFKEIMVKKYEIFKSIPAIVSLLGSNTETDISSNNGNNYQLGCHSFISADLRQAKNVISALSESGFDSTLPTLFISECVLVYMEREYTLNLCSELLQYIQSNSIWITYDMINPNDMYGKSMIKNLQNSGFFIPGIQDFPNLNEQKNRFLLTGWNNSKSCTMRYYYDHILTNENHNNIIKLEILDEVEEWNILMEHYSLTIAVKYDGDNNTIYNDILDIIP